MLFIYFISNYNQINTTISYEILFQEISYHFSAVLRLGPVAILLTSALQLGKDSTKSLEGWENQDDDLKEEKGLSSILIDWSSGK